MLIDKHFENRHTIYSYFDFGLKNSSFRLPYQCPSSSADCTRELFKGSNGLASLVDCTRKKFLFFCDWGHKWSSFGVILSHVAWARAQPLGQSVSLKFSLETRLESKTFDPLIDFLAFLVFLDYSLVSNKNFSEILPSKGWRPESGKVGQGGLRVLHLWHYSQKMRNPQAKNFLSSAD